jgi:hypothetical protein
LRDDDGDVAGEAVSSDAELDSILSRRQYAQENVILKGKEVLRFRDGQRRWLSINFRTIGLMRAESTQVLSATVGVPPRLGGGLISHPAIRKVEFIGSASV